MRLVSFDPFRTLGLPGVTYIKPENMYVQQDTLRGADWLLFPAYWQIGALAFALQGRLFPSLPSYVLGHDKVEMTRALSMLVPQHLPATVIEANTPGQAERVWECMPLPFVAKVPRSSQGVGVYLITCRADWHDYLQRTDVIYVQEQLPIDRDLRVVVVGDRIIGHYWRLQGHDGFHNNIARGGRCQQGAVPEAALDLVMRLSSELHIDHAGFDIAMVDGHAYVLEFNRLFGNQGLPGGPALLAEAMMDYLQRRCACEGPRQWDGTPPLLLAV